MARGASRGRSGADARVRSGLERRDAGRARLPRVSSSLHPPSRADRGTAPRDERRPPPRARRPSPTRSRRPARASSRGTSHPRANGASRSATRASRPRSLPRAPHADRCPAGTSAPKARSSRCQSLLWLTWIRPGSKSARRRIGVDCLPIGRNLCEKPSETRAIPATSHCGFVNSTDRERRKRERPICANGPWFGLPFQIESASFNTSREGRYRCPPSSFSPRRQIPPGRAARSAARGGGRHVARAQARRARPRPRLARRVVGSALAAGARSGRARARARDRRVARGAGVARPGRARGRRQAARGRPRAPRRGERGAQTRARRGRRDRPERCAGATNREGDAAAPRGRRGAVDRGRPAAREFGRRAS